MDSSQAGSFVARFRDALPYINAHRGRIFVLVVGGEAVRDAGFANIVHDVALLSSLGIKLVLVHGARPQIEERLRSRGIEVRYVHGLRVTDAAALECVKEAVGSVRVEVEALLSMGLANSPMAGARIRAVSGNLVTARPLGVRDGVDFLHTGEVRRVDGAGIRRLLDQGDVVLLSPLGYSPTGEAFNLSAEDVGTAAAVELQAAKLLCLVPGTGLEDPSGKRAAELTVAEAEQLLAGGACAEDGCSTALVAAVHACRGGVARSHLIPHRIDGGLLLELFTRDGIGTLIATDPFEGTRAASVEDLGGILELIRPLEQEGVLVRRSREYLEMEIERFFVVERDGTVIATAALYPYPSHGVGELTCLAVHPDYRKSRRGSELLSYAEQQALRSGLSRLFVLTTRTAHWFLERGFRAASLSDLPLERQQMYNYQRNSKVFVKQLE
jgi:amino-acid N-acetyltransferase